MNQEFRGWDKVRKNIRTLAGDVSLKLKFGQAASLRGIAERLPDNGVIIADEVGMGKTRIAAVVARSVVEEGGRVAILVPPGLGYQWRDELRAASIEAPLILRSLWQYLQVWDIDSKNKQRPWFDQDVVLISHAFSNWRLGQNSDPWRWALLPEIYARWRKQSNGRWPRDYSGNKILDDERARQAAESIVKAMSVSEGHPAQKRIQELADKTPWPGALIAGEYARDSQLRPWLERAVGLGLGVFDLVIVDEAHKSRGQDSGLNQLLDKVILQSDDPRRLAMTATPVEIDATQWLQMLGRIQVDEASKNAATEAIDNYTQAVARVRQCPSDIDARDKYKKSAKVFEEALKNYLLRRDKREDPGVSKFQSITGESYHGYRCIQEILIDTAQLNSEWKQAVCAAEALSFVTHQSDHTAAKRLRLTLGNGHGIAALMDQLQRDDKDDHKQTEADDVPAIVTQPNAETEMSSNKRLLRAEWWQEVMIQPFGNEGSALFDHPAILAAVEKIEEICQRGEKVLVFGRFTRPLRALVQLLNAREMLRCIDRNSPWPQSKVLESEWPAVVAAYQQLKELGELDREQLDRALAEQYKTLVNQRRNIRENLIDKINDEFNNIQPCPDKRVRALFDAFKNSATKDSTRVQNNNDDTLAVVTRAIQELTGESSKKSSSTNFAQAFIDLVEAASDRDGGDVAEDEQTDDVAVDLWNDIIDRLKVEYNRPEGGYARLMYGATEPATRRMLQLAFNREQARPKVLVAQSLVGREGLNLHSACRTVVLLHPEWNPGVVEQQIGRVDRIGSLWEKLLNEIPDGIVDNKIPRIEIFPIIFRGTYDQKNWEVLDQRWNDLRAQLHGIIIPQNSSIMGDTDICLINEINNSAPNFSPNN